jgi:hypothetical protein
MWPVSQGTNIIWMRTTVLWYCSPVTTLSLLTAGKELKHLLKEEIGREHLHAVYGIQFPNSQVLKGREGK